MQHQEKLKPTLHFGQNPVHTHHPCNRECVLRNSCMSGYFHPSRTWKSRGKGSVCPRRTFSTAAREVSALAYSIRSADLQGKVEPRVREDRLQVWGPQQEDGYALQTDRDTPRKWQNEKAGLKPDFSKYFNWRGSSKKISLEIRQNF